MDFVDTVSLHEYNNTYYLRFNNIRPNLELTKAFAAFISEFANYVSNSDLFEGKLLERGKIIADNNAIEIVKKYFS